MSRLLAPPGLSQQAIGGYATVRKPGESGGTFAAVPRISTTCGWGAVTFEHAATT